MGRGGENVLNHDKLYPHYTQKPKLKDFAWVGFTVLAAIGGYNVLLWLTVDVLGWK